MIAGKKKVLFIIYSYTCGGGSEALLTMIANHLNPEKYDVSIIEYYHSDVKTEPVNENIHVLPPIERVETADHQKKGYQVYHTPEIMINKYIKGDYDLYVSFNYQIPTFLLPRGTKNIAWIHGDVYKLGGEDMAREWRLQDEAFDKVKKIVAISDRTYQSLYDLFPRHREKILKIYNGFDLESKRIASGRETDIELKKPSVVVVGRLDGIKNPERMMEVFSLVHPKRKDAHLYYIGEGERRELLNEMIQTYGLEESVHLLGWQGEPLPIVKQADVLAHFSLREGFGLGMAEAVALGVPIVAPDIGVAKALTNNGACGKIVDTNEEAADAILELFKADKEEMQRNCLESIRQFALEPYIARIEELFDSVIGD